MTETAFILLGSNMGDREKNLASAISRIEAIPGFELTGVSSVYVSEADDMDKGSPSFLNQVVMGDYQYRPNELLAALEAIEKQLGRTGKGKNQPRTIDLDILLFGNQVVETERLSIPHRKLLNRPFAMAPLLEIDPQIVHPVVNRPVAEFLTDEQKQQVLLYRDHVARKF
ncbi:MAG: 2-amino-4-hydroxy-6-hydroxymethyldihydropteridine diphosphokinase [Candidatus Zixiibacteriota bacterium]